MASTAGTRPFVDAAARRTATTTAIPLLLLPLPGRFAAVSPFPFPFSPLARSFWPDLEFFPLFTCLGMVAMREGGVSTVVASGSGLVGWCDERAGRGGGEDEMGGDVDMGPGMFSTVK